MFILCLFRNSLVKSLFMVQYSKFKVLEKAKINEDKFIVDIDIRKL